MLHDRSVLPTYFSDEPAMSWFCRWAGMMGYVSPLPLASRLKLSLHEISRGKANVRLARLVGLPDDAFDHGTVVVEGAEGTTRFGGEPLDRRFMYSHPRVCLSCLQEDSRKQGRRGELLPRLRVAWQLKCFQACPIHREFLTAMGSEGRLLSLSWTDLIRDIDRGHKFPPDARGQAADVVAAEAYLLGRFGSAKPVSIPLLDSCAPQALPSFLLNVALAYHRRTTLPSNARELSLFVNDAFPALADAASFRGLLELCDQARRKRLPATDPRQHDLYPELNRAFGARPYGDRLLGFRQIAAEYISERYPTGDDKVSYDCPVAKQLYSLGDVYDRTGMHIRKARKIIDHIGIEFADAEKMYLRKEALDQFEAVMDSMVDFADLVSMWGMTHETTRNLIASRIIVPWVGGSTSDLHKFLFRREDAEEILRKAVGGCKRVCRSRPEPLLTLRQASARPGLSHVQLVRDLVDGRVKPAAILPEKTGLSGILLDPRDIQPMTMDRFESKLTITQVVEVLGVFHPVAVSLAIRGYLDGEKKCGKARLFEIEAVADFRERYLSAHQAASVLGTHARTVRVMLAENGIFPSIPSEEVRTNFYDRARVMRLAEEMSPQRSSRRGRAGTDPQPHHFRPERRP